LVLGRDRFGIKPLFWAQGASSFAFASELKALLHAPGVSGELDWSQVLSDPAINSTMPKAAAGAPVSFFRDVQQLPAGTILTVAADGRAMETRTYYEPDPDTASILLRSPEDAVAAYGEALERSVHDNLMADVEVGLFLSGGVDSAVIAAIASKVSRLHTFSVASASTLANGDARAAHEVARTLGLPNHQVLFEEEAEGWGPERWKQLLWLCETPLCGPEQLFKFQLHAYAKSVRPALKVILTGQGSDEFNGGYSSVLGDGGGWEEFLATLQRHGLREERRTDPVADIWEEHLQAPILRRAEASPTELYHSFLERKFRDLQMYNCWHEDRTAAGNGIENRVPFLAADVVDAANSVPAELRHSLLDDKQILRRAAAELLPRALAARPKVAFYHGARAADAFEPILTMLAAEDCRLVEEAFAGAVETPVDHQVARRVLEELRQQPDATRSAFFLRLVNAGLLAARREVPAPRPPLPTALLDADWGQLEAALGGPAVGPETVLELAPGVMTVQRLGHGDTPGRYIAINGQIEYELDREELGSWFEMLPLLVRPVALSELCERFGVAPAEVEAQVAEAIELGVIVSSAPSGGNA